MQGQVELVLNYTSYVQRPHVDVCVCVFVCVCIYRYVCVVYKVYKVECIIHNTEKNDFIVYLKIQLIITYAYQALHFSHAKLK